MPEAQEGIIYLLNVVLLCDLIFIPNHCFSVVTYPVKNRCGMRTAVNIGILYYCPMITMLLKSLKCNASLKSVKKNNAKGYLLEPQAHLTNINFLHP